MNMNMLMQQAQKMQRDIEKAKEEFEAKEFNYSAAGGAIEIVIKGNKKLSSINIDESLLEDKEMLEDCIKAAIDGAIDMNNSEYEKAMAKVSGGMNIPGMF